MARTQTMVQLNDELLETLDHAAARRGSSRSVLIRELLWEGLRQDRDALIGQQIAEGYRRIPQGTVEEWGDLSASNRASRSRVLERLEAEERAAGFEPW